MFLTERNSWTDPCRKQRKRTHLGDGSTKASGPSSDLIERQCRLCFMGEKRNRDLTLSVGMHVYMALPERGSLSWGHVCLIPVEHTPSFRAADDDVYEELKNFQKCLIKMFEGEVGKHECVAMSTRFLFAIV